MDLKSMIVETLRSERRLTREVIAAMTDGDVAFKPTPEQMSFGGQALHILFSQSVLTDAFQGKGWNWEKGGFSAEAYPTLEAVLAKFDDVIGAENGYYESLAPEEFERAVPIGWGPPEPVAKLIISFLAHEAHHRGQMVAYLRLKGMTPPKY